MKFNHMDVEVLSRNIAGEGRGESDVGMVAIAYSVINRAKRKGWTPAEACLKSVHYSAWNNAAWNDANQLTMLTLDSASAVFARCEIAARQALHGLVEDPTQGATHYYVTGTPEPDWAKGKTPCCIIGHHQFYKNIAF